MTRLADRAPLRRMARALRQTGLSQTAIGHELGVPRQTVSRWLNSPIAHNGQEAPGAHNELCKSPAPRYLVVRGGVEKFQPPDDVVFPLIIADPPWFVSDPGHRRERSARPKRPFTKDFGPWDHFKSEKSYLARCRQWLGALYSVAAPDAWLFFWCSYLHISHILRLAEGEGWRGHNWFVWHKTNPLPMFGNNNFLAAVEAALVLAKGSPVFSFRGGGQPHNRWESPQVSGAQRVKNHDGSAANLTQKPLDLTRLWVRWASTRGDWVLDAFAGTGTATVAALLEGRNACAVELDPALVAAIQARVVRECPGVVL